MTKLPFTPALLVIALLVGACSATPTRTSLLDETRSNYRAAENNPDVVRYAPLELKQAGDALTLANNAATKEESADTVDKLAYVAKQKTAQSQEMAKQKVAEAEVARTGKQRDQIRLDQRTIEANQAKAKADDALFLVQAAQSDKANAQLQTMDAQARATRLEAQLAELSARQTDRGLVITLNDVMFGIDLANLNPDGMRTAQKLADMLQQNPQRTVLVEGFADSTGSTEHNQNLSERRAGAVQTALLGMGIARGRIAARGYGEAYPIATNTSEANRQMNRRVEIVVSGTDGQIPQR